MSFSSASHSPKDWVPFDIAIMQKWFSAAVKIQTAWRSHQERKVLCAIYEQALNPQNSFFKEVDYAESAMKRLEKSLYAVKDSNEEILRALDKQILACQPIRRVVNCSLVDDADEIKEEITEMEIDAEYQMWMADRELRQTPTCNL